jgi:hypothetical protein
LSPGWNACAFAPQWISGEWGYSVVVDSVRLNVNQSPDGVVRHEIRFQDSGGTWSAPWILEEYFVGYQVLTRMPPAPVPDARAIRIDTVQGPSWVSWNEVEVHGHAVPTATSTTSWGQVKAIFR